MTIASFPFLKNVMVVAKTTKSKFTYDFETRTDPKQ